MERPDEEGRAMAALSIRDLDDSVKEKLRQRAARHGRSMEAEIRLILTAAATEDERPQNDLFSALTERFTQLGGVDLEVPARTTSPRAADLSE
ncbi:FitA-like ribbon-helix-helix domain-containing protein [Paractinoplanes deccanensis]|nr:Arc family DNA-binding protein [Actinoplanes deccanensis]